VILEITFTWDLLPWCYYMNQHCLMFVDFIKCIKILMGYLDHLTCDLKGYLGLRVHMILFFIFSLQWAWSNVIKQYPWLTLMFSWYYNMTTIILVPNVMQMNRIDMKKLRGLIFEVILSFQWNCSNNGHTIHYFHFYYIILVWICIMHLSIILCHPSNLEPSSN
jgi:hypothetical protein